MDLGRIAAVWGSVVGERLARETAPVDLEAGVLTVAASNSIWGAQVRFLVEEIRRSANETLGSEAIREVRIAIR
jgi:predicted nucleic acid-binding Zn ribbon protein